jgi:hypothetical protein
MAGVTHLNKYQILKVSIVVNQSPLHEDVYRSGCIAPAFLTLTLDGGEWSASHPAALPRPPNIPIA